METRRGYDIGLLIFGGVYSGGGDSVKGSLSGKTGSNEGTSRAEEDLLLKSSERRSHIQKMPHLQAPMTPACYSLARVLAQIPRIVGTLRGIFGTISDFACDCLLLSQLQ